MFDITPQIKTILKDKRIYYNLRSEYLSLWKNWYEGFDKDFHVYQVYNGTNYVKCTKKTLGMAKQVCEDWRSLLLNEKTDIVLPKNKKKILDLILKRTKFWNKANDGLEISYALGIGAFVNRIENVTISNDGRIIKRGKFNTDFIDAERIYPITIENGIITECAFASFSTRKVNIQVHLFEDNQYDIYQYTLSYDGTNWVLNGDYDVFRTGSDIAWFSFIKPQITNNLDLCNSTGISIYANSIDTLKALDNKYDSFDNEFNLGRKRVYVSAEATQITNQNGKQDYVPTFDPSDVVFYRLPADNENKQYVQTDTSQLRVQEHISAINQELNILSSKCGLGENYYKFDGGGRPVQTATAAILQQGNLFRKIKKEEIGLEDFLLNFTRSLIYICNNFTDDNFGDVNDNDIIITFDDSIIDDKDKQRATDLADYNAGTMSLVEYRMKWYSEDYDTAMKYIRENMLDTLINKYTPALQNGAVTPSDFVRIVYGEDDKFDERVAYITDNLSSSNPTDLPDLGI